MSLKVTDFIGENVFSLVSNNFHVFLHLPSERYLEQVTPLLVYAQRQLLVRISLSKEIDITQQACARYEAEHGEKVNMTLYVYTIVIFY